MKYFLCAFDAAYLGIPSERTERVISISANGPFGSGKQSSVCETDDKDIFISLPLLFGRADLSTPHGIVLKPGNGKRKVTLLAPPLDIDLEIPEEHIYTVPKVFGEMLHYCRGAGFIKKDQGDRLVFIVDTEKLAEDFK